MLWIRRHWIALLSAIPLIPTVFKWLGWLVSRGGDMDFVISRTNDPGWVGTMIGWIINPPGWAILPLIAGGLFLIWLDVRRRADVQVKDQITTPQIANAPYGTRPEKVAPKGEKLIELGQTILIVAGVISIVGMVFGLFLILLGDWQAKRAAMRAPAKSEIAQSAPPPVKAREPDPIVEIPAAPTPVPSPPSPPATPAREFVKEGITPEYLVGLYDGSHTASGANLRASVFTGKWMQVTGALGEVVGGEPFLSGRSPAVGSLKSTTGTSFLLVFKGEWIERAAMVPKNQTVTVRGKIQEISRSYVTLEDVELIEPRNEGPTRSPRARRGTAERKRRKTRPG